MEEGEEGEGAVGCVQEVLCVSSWSMMEREEGREGARSARGTNDTTRSFFHLAYRTQLWNAQLSSSTLGSVKCSARSGMPLRRDRHESVPAIDAARGVPEGERVNDRVSERSKSVREGSIESVRCREGGRGSEGTDRSRSRRT